MEWLFGRKKTPDEILKENRRALDRAIRDIEREKVKMEQQEVKLVNELRKDAKANEMDSVRIKAKDLVRTRNQVKKFNLMRANIQAISLKTLTLKSQSSMASAMRGVTQGLVRMNRQMNIPQINRIISEFEKQTDMIDMKEEMINDVMDDVFEEDTDEQESDHIVNQVLDELGIELKSQLAEIPSGGSLPVAGQKDSVKQPTAQATGGGGGGGVVDIDEIESRINSLRQD